MTDYKDREELLREIKRLQAQLKAEQEENALLRRLLFMQYEKQPKAAERLKAPSSPQVATDLFEGLPETFTLDDVFAAGDRLELQEREVAEHVRRYLRDEMIVHDVEAGSFTKTGRKAMR